MPDREREFMLAAIDSSRRSLDDRDGKIPRVGAVATVDDRMIATAFRGEIEPDQHAEYILLEEHLKSVQLVNATIYTTLEPCTRRGKTRDGKEKIPCVDRLIERKVRKVVIGMLDPNPIVRGLGFRKLRSANIITEVFPDGLMAQVEEINHNFVRAIESNPVHQRTQELAVLCARGVHDLQRRAIAEVLDDALKMARKIDAFQIPIGGNETGYFRRWIDLVTSFDQPERVSAYIRLTGFDPSELLTRNWFIEFYSKLQQMVSSGKLSLRYVFLLGTNKPTRSTEKFLDSFRPFAEEVRTVDRRGETLAPDLLKPSIVLFHNQQVAFTHDRGDNGILTEADEWILPRDFERLERRFQTLQLASSVRFSKDEANIR